jgi:hypothetical protein
MDEEFDSLVSNETFTLTMVPPNREIVGGKWVYTIKSGPNDEETYKARYVAKGYSQVPGVDYHETFAPTARMSSIRVLIIIIIIIYIYSAHIPFGICSYAHDNLIRRI